MRWRIMSGSESSLDFHGMVCVSSRFPIKFSSEHALEAHSSIRLRAGFLL